MPKIEWQFAEHHDPYAEDFDLRKSKYEVELEETAAEAREFVRKHRLEAWRKKQLVADWFQPAFPDSVYVRVIGVYVCDNCSDFHLWLAACTWKDGRVVATVYGAAADQLTDYKYENDQPPPDVQIEEIAMIEVISALQKAASHVFNGAKIELAVIPVEEVYDSTDINDEDGENKSPDDADFLLADFECDEEVWN